MRTAFSSIVWNTGSSFARRAADDLQHLRGRSLLLQRLGQFVGALAQFIEQPDVLDRDDRLVGEGLHESDLCGGEWPHLASPASDCAYRRLLSKNGDGHERPILKHTLEHVSRAWIVVDLRQDILEMHRLTLHDRPAHDEVSSERSWEQAVKGLGLFHRQIVEGHEMEQPILVSRD